MVTLTPGGMLNICLVPRASIIVLFWFSPMIVMFLSMVMFVLLVPVYVPPAMFTVPLSATVPVALFMVNFAVLQL